MLLAPQVRDYIVGTNGVANTITGGLEADTIIITTQTVDTVVFATNTVATTDVITGFTFPTDVFSLSVTQNGAVATVNRIANSANGAAAGASVVEVVSGATTLGATTNVIAVNGTFTNVAAVITAIGGGTRAVTTNTSLTANSDLVVAWSNGTDLLYLHH